MLVVLRPTTTDSTHLNLRVDDGRWRTNGSLSYGVFGQCREVLVDVLWETSGDIGDEVWAGEGTIDIHGIKRDNGLNVEVEVSEELERLMFTFFHLVDFLVRANTGGIPRDQWPTAKATRIRWVEHLRTSAPRLGKSRMPSTSQIGVDLNSYMFSRDISNGTIPIDVRKGESGGNHYRPATEHDRGTYPTGSITNIPIHWMRFSPAISLLTYGVRMFHRLAEFKYVPNPNLMCTCVGWPNLVYILENYTGYTPTMGPDQAAYYLWGGMLGTFGEALRHFRYGGVSMWTFLHMMIHAVCSEDYTKLTEALASPRCVGFESWLYSCDTNIEHPCSNAIRKVMDAFEGPGCFITPRNYW